MFNLEDWKDGENGDSLGKEGYLGKITGEQLSKRRKGPGKSEIDNQAFINFQKHDFVVFFEYTKGCEGQAPLPTINFAINRY